MEKKVFRSKSIDRISSPEQLNDYVRVSNPGVWMALVAIIVLLIGVCVWGVFGKMDATLPTVVIVKDSSAVCYVKENAVGDVKVGQVIRVGDAEYTVKNIPSVPVSVTNDTDAYALHIGELTVGEWVYEVKLDADMADGIYSGKIITKSVSFMSFLVN